MEEVETIHAKELRVMYCIVYMSFLLLLLVFIVVFASLFACPRSVNPNPEVERMLLEIANVHDAQ